MTRRRKRSKQVRSVGLSAMLIPAVAGPLAGWAYLGRPFDFGGHYAPTWHFTGLMLMLAAGLMIWPLFVLTVLMSPDALRGACVPRVCRVWWRQYQIGRGIPREGQRSAYISVRLRRVIYFADRNRCSSCRGRLGIEIDHLEIDHLRPWRWGGLTTLFNSTTLCGPCNKIKLDYWRERGGYVHFARRYAIASTDQAAEVLRRMRRHRRNPVRWLLAAWALTA